MYKYRRLNLSGPVTTPLTFKASWLYSVLVWLAALLLLWEQFDEVIDAKDGDGGLCGKFEALSLDHSRLVHTSLAVVSGLAIHKVQTNPEGRDSKVESEFNICVN